VFGPNLSALVNLGNYFFHCWHRSSPLVFFVTLRAALLRASS
jgi:hypothetical protein